jgi:hypothetical protein
MVFILNESKKIILNDKSKQKTEKPVPLEKPAFHHEVLTRNHLFIVLQDLSYAIRRYTSIDLITYHYDRSKATGANTTQA